MNLNRRSLLQLSTAAVALLALPASAQAIDELVIAYNVSLPAWDPTTGPSAVNPTIQGLYQSVFDQFILQGPDLKPAPGLLTEWGWNEDKTQVWMTVREGVTWHDGSPFTAEDVAWSLARAANPETGNSHVTLEMPYEEFDRLKGGPLTGISAPISDIGMIFLNDIDAMKDPNVRKAAALSIDKQAIIDRLMGGYGVRIDTLQTTQYEAYDASITTEYNPEKAVGLLAASGFSVDNPVKFKIQTTKGFKPKDYEMIQAIVGLWRKVGIEVEIEVYEIAKHYELRAADQLAPAAFYNWGNSVGDPTTSTGFAMFGPSPHSVWDGEDLIGMIGPLWGEKDEAKRIEGWKAVDRFVAENALVIPLLQYVQPILAAPGVLMTPHASGALLPHLMKRA